MQIMKIANDKERDKMIKKDKNKQVEKVSKVSITIAWILLILLIVAALSITYLKFFGPNDKLEEHPVNDNTTSPVIIEALQNIVDNFNNSDLIDNYKTENITMTASLDNTTITINYEGVSSKTYNFDFNSPKLTTIINKNDTVENTDNEFNEIFKVLVYAVQARLNNTNNIDNYIMGFLNDSLEVEGISKEISDSFIAYSIDISKTIGINDNNDDNNVVENNNTDTVDITNTDNSSVDNNITNNGEKGE